MKCSNCGKKLTGEENFCRICGTPVSKDEDNSKSIEMTDNIDISKINISNNENTIDDTVELENTGSQKSQELSAMMELSNKEETVDIPKEEKKEKRGRKKKEKNSSEKIKEILEEIKPEIENSEIEIDEMKEPTSIIPENLIDEYKKENNITDVEKEDKEEDIKEESNVENSVEEVKEEVEEKEEELVDKIEENTDNKNSEDDVVDEKIISIVDNKTMPIELSDQKTQLYDEPIISSSTDDEDDFNFKQHSDAKGIVFLVLFLISLLSLCAVGFLFFNTNNKLNKVTKDYDELKEKANSTDDTKPVSNEITSNEFINYNGYTINLTDKYSFSNNKLIINKTNKTVEVVIRKDLKYTTVKYAKDDYKSNLSSDDINVQSYGTKVVDDREYVVYELENSDKKYYLVAYTKLSEDDTIGFIIKNEENTIDYDELDNINKFISNIKEHSLNEENDINLFVK